MKLNQFSVIYEEKVFFILFFLSNMTSCFRPYTEQEKWIVASVSGALFAVVSSPISYQVVGSVLKPLGLETASSKGCPNIQGLVVQGAVFTGLLRWMMEMKQLPYCIQPSTNQDKWIMALIGGLMFVILSSPYVYQTERELVKGAFEASDVQGCPTATGLVFNTALYIVITRLLMR